MDGEIEDQQSQATSPRKALVIISIRTKICSHAFLTPKPSYSVPCLAVFIEVVFLAAPLTDLKASSDGCLLLAHLHSLCLGPPSNQTCLLQTEHKCAHLYPGFNRQFSSWDKFALYLPPVQSVAGLWFQWLEGLPAVCSPSPLVIWELAPLTGNRILHSTVNNQWLEALEL